MLCLGLRLTESPNSVNIPNISRSIIPVDSRSSNISVTTSISECSSNPIDVSSATVNDRPRIWIPAVEASLKPSKGHVFTSLTQAYDFYKHYGKIGGFDIKLGTEKNYHGTEVPDIKYFNCTKGGKKGESKYDNHKFDVFSVCNIDKGKGIAVASSVCSVANGKGKGKVTVDLFSGKGKTIDFSDVSNPDDVFSGKGKNVDVSDVSKPIVKRPFRKNTSCKTGCLARMMVRKIDGGMFEIYGFVEEHNHPLVSQEDMQFMISSRELGFSKQQFMLQVANSNVGPVRAFKLMKEMYGGFENVGATATDCKNFRRDLNLFIGDRDAQMVVEKLENLEKRCDSFFMDYCQGEGDSLCGLFWADKVARLNYQRFGDTISFDATFRSNKYRMVFVPFTGIDNHNRSVTFGAGLLSDETVKSYKWLLQSFKKAFVADPQVVVTDQDASMKQAVEAEFPNARHRLCMWHIMQKLVTKVGSSVCNKSNFKQRFCSIVWNERISIDMFEQEWASIMDEFDLGSHKWLCDLYGMRHRWIPAFLRNEDMSGLMRTTSRSESENRYFNRFTNPDLTLVEFIGHFESAMDIQRYTQKKNDHESRYNRPEFRTDWPLEKDAAELFTLNIFYEIQDEIVASIAKCLSVNVEQMGGSEKYFIRDTDVKKWKDSTQFEVYEVFYCSSDTILTCSCRRCFSPDENVWVDTSAVACDTSSNAAIRAIRRIFEDTVDRLVPFKEKLDLYRLELSDLLAKAEADVPVLMRVNNKDTFCSMLGVTEPERVVIKVPRHSANKGTGSHKRWKNMDELIQNAAESSKKRRTCFVCGKAEGHNCRTCPHKDEINSANKRTKRVTRSSAANYEE
ncbi:FAR1-related sequence 5-like protein [Tanacetum coccineum]